MSDVKWTPGPWSVVDAPNVWTDALSIESGDGTVAVTTRGFEADEHGDDGPSWSNARLISAAPDMYEALDKFVAQYVDMVNSGDCGFWNPEDEDFVKAARAALAKARGDGQ